MLQIATTMVVGGTGTHFLASWAATRSLDADRFDKQAAAMHSVRSVLEVYLHRSLLNLQLVLVIMKSSHITQP